MSSSWNARAAVGKRRDGTTPVSTQSNGPGSSRNTQARRRRTSSNVFVRLVPAAGEDVQDFALDYAAAADVLGGGQSRDCLVGGDGDDVLDGGNGSQDVCIGGAGIDTFVECETVVQ